MFSTRCTSCHQLISLKIEEIQAAIAEAEAANHAFYSLPCPKCRKPVKIQVKELKHKLPHPPVEMPVETPTTDETSEE